MTRYLTEAAEAEAAVGEAEAEAAAAVEDTAFKSLAALKENL